MCPHCGQAAPLVYRGVIAYCSACGQLRGPLTGGSVTHAGSLSKASGTVARAFGWVVLALGWTLALIVFAIVGAVFGLGVAAPWLLGGVIGVLTTAIALFSLWGGRELKASGQQRELSTKEQAVFAMAATHQGELRAVNLMAPLNMTRHDAELLLENMAKQNPDDLRMEVDEQGGLYYRFPRYRQRVAVRLDGAAPEVVHDPLLEQFEELERQEQQQKRQKMQG